MIETNPRTGVRIATVEPEPRGQLAKQEAAARRPKLEPLSDEERRLICRALLRSDHCGTAEMAACRVLAERIADGVSRVVVFTTEEAASG